MTTTATTTSAPGTYPISFATEGLTAANYNFNYVNGTLTVTQASQTINFAPLPNVTYGASPITLAATTSSGQAVTYTVTGPAALTNSTLTITGTGTVAVTANQTGNPNYTAATAVTPKLHGQSRYADSDSQQRHTAVWRNKLTLHLYRYRLRERRSSFSGHGFSHTDHHSNHHLGSGDLSNHLLNDRIDSPQLQLQLPQRNTDHHTGFAGNQPLHRCPM